MTVNKEKGKVTISISEYEEMLSTIGELEKEIYNTKKEFEGRATYSILQRVSIPYYFYENTPIYVSDYEIIDNEKAEAILKESEIKLQEKYREYIAQLEELKTATIFQFLKWKKQEV